MTVITPSPRDCVGPIHRETSLRLLAAPAELSNVLGKDKRRFYHEVVHTLGQPQHNSMQPPQDASTEANRLCHTAAG